MKFFEHTERKDSKSPGKGKSSAKKARQYAKQFFETNGSKIEYLEARIEALSVENKELTSKLENMANVQHQSVDYLSGKLNYLFRYLRISPNGSNNIET